MDRAPIDWSALVRRAPDPERGFALDMLRRLDTLRGGSRGGVEPGGEGAWSLVLRLMVGVGAAQTVLGLTGLATVIEGRAPAGDGVGHAVLSGMFASASVLLASAVPRDRRVFDLLAVFILTACAFARPLIDAQAAAGPVPWEVAVRGVYPEAFAQAALWRFAVLFPSVPRFTGFDLFARRAATTACVVGTVLFFVNLLLAHGVAPAHLALLARNHPGNLFWQVFACSALVALAVIVIRAAHAPWMERMKVSRFAWSIGAGAAPLLGLGLARTIPGVDAWMLNAGFRSWFDGAALSALAAMPLLATGAVLVDAPFGASGAMRPGAGRRLSTWSARLAAIPLRIVRPRRHRERLSAALERVRLARGSREIVAILERELTFGVGASTVLVVHPGTLPPGLALLPVLEASAGVIDLSRGCEPFVLLPRQDRKWLDARRITLGTAVRRRDGTIAAVVLLGGAGRENWFDRADRWFIAALVCASSAAWEAGAAPEAGGECGDECERCGRVRPAGGPGCCAAAASRLAALPTRFATFAVTRRLGAGGMGIVYLGRDLSLGREVALKTLPRLHDDRVERLRREARVMAALNHEALATIYGFELWRGAPVLVVEYCPGGTLADALARGPLPLDDVLRLGVRLAGALAYMHDRGVLHRDVKPSNIGFTALGAAKLLDFGLAGADDHPAGTPAYLPPEAFDGAPPDAAVDLWALATVLRQACEADDRLDAFVERALSPRPCERFQSATSFGAALAALQPRAAHTRG